MTSKMLGFNIIDELIDVMYTKIGGIDLVFHAIKFLSDPQRT